MFRPKSDEWDATDNAERYKYLNWASTLIKSAFAFHANVEVDNNEKVRVAVCEQALWLMRRTDQYPDVLTKGIVNASVGPMSTTFSKDFIAPLICQEVKLILAEIATFICNRGVVRTMPLGGPFAEPMMPHKKMHEKKHSERNYQAKTDQEVIEENSNCQFAEVIDIETINQILNSTGFPVIE